MEARTSGVRRRDFLAAVPGAGLLALSPAFVRRVLAAPARAGTGPYGPLQPTS